MTMVCVLPVALLLARSGQRPFRIEAESGDCFKTVVAHKRQGYSGTGYVTNFVEEGAKLTLRFKARAGIYDAKIGYCAASGQKGFQVLIDGISYSGMFAPTGPGFETQDAGNVELKDGENSATIERGWGYFDIDYIEFAPAGKAPPLKRPPKTLCDPKAMLEVRELFGRLIDLYGTKALSGAYSPADSDHIKAVSGHTPAILGGDFIDYSPSRVAFQGMPAGDTEKLIEAAAHGQIVTISWHWNAPTDLINKTYKDKDGKEVNGLWYKGFYTNATTFDVAKALDNPDSEEYRLILRDIDAIAVQLKKLAERHIPILWRPLHEAEGGWFWWGAHGPEPFKKLWRLLYERLTEVQGLHNLIWVFTVGDNPDWYPGDRYVDVLGVDAYPDLTDPLNYTWDRLQAQYGGRKLVALTEFGGVPDIDKMWRFGDRWAYFVPWVGTVKEMKRGLIARVYNSFHVGNDSIN